MSERQTTGEFKNYIIGKKSGKTYNKIQEMAKEIDRLQKENEELKDYKERTEHTIKLAKFTRDQYNKLEKTTREIFNKTLKEYIDKDKIRDIVEKSYNDIDYYKRDIIVDLEKLLEE